MASSAAYSTHLFSQPASRLRKALVTLLLLLLLPAALPTASWAQQAHQQEAAFDPPGRVARLSLAEGAVSFAPADDGSSQDSNWRAAELNRPLTRGDRLWTGLRARAELHIGSTAVRMSEATSLDFLALDDDTTQLRLVQGTVQLRVRALFEGQRLEVDTPNLAFVISQPGNYRLDVSPASNTTRVVAQSGSGLIYGDSGVSLPLDSAQQGSFSGTELTPAAPGPALQDSFDIWAAERDRREDQSIAARYIPRETIGYQQLDSYGDWQQDASYGAVWLPRATPANWAPYRAGHWSWIAPWGWTWVDDAPWGFAPFHYGRWAQIGPRWAWVPGKLPPRPVYAPALVAFISSGDANWNAARAAGGTPRPALGWFPLAPGEAFQPAYRASPRYVTRVNNNLIIANRPEDRVDLYRYQRQPAAVTAISRDDFARGRPVPRHWQALGAADLSRASVLADRVAMPQPLRSPDLRARPRFAPEAWPARVATPPMPQGRDDHGSDRRPFLNPASQAPNGNEPRTERFGNTERMGQGHAPTPAMPQAPALTATLPARPPAAQPVPAPLPATPRSSLDPREQARREPRFGQREQERQPTQAPQGRPNQASPSARSPGNSGNGGTPPPSAPDARAAAERNAAEQAQRSQQQRQQQRQQMELMRQQEQQRRQTEALLRQQRVQQEQTQHQHQHQQQQAQQQRTLQQDQQRQAHEQQRQQQDQHRQQAQERQQARPAAREAAQAARPESDYLRRREP